MLLASLRLTSVVRLASIEWAMALTAPLALVVPLKEPGRQVEPLMELLVESSSIKVLKAVPKLGRPVCHCDVLVNWLLTALVPDKDEVPPVPR